MFKRTNKLTALLVAAAAVVAVVPTTANAAERLGSKEGNLTSGYSYAEGKYVYDGYLTDDDDTALYFNDGEKDTEVEDYDDYDYDDSVRYGTKYVTVKDGSDTYLLDLSTGKIDDDESLEDKADNLKSKLKTNLKKADRYEDLEKTEDITNFERVLEDKYGEVWYKYTAKGDDDAATATNNGEYIGFVNADGKYIDASNLANIYVYSKDKGKTVKFENFGDSEEFVKGADGKYEEATLVLDDITVIDQDDDYLYALTKVTVNKEDHIFFQKIAKEQGDKKDGAYVPKSVASYEVDKDVIYSDGDMKDGAEQLLKALDKTSDFIDVKVKDNMIHVAIYDDKDTVKVFKLKFKKDKVDAYTGEEKKVKSNVDAYIVLKDGDCDEDITDLNDAKPVSYDIDGNLWILGKGKIFKYDGSDFKEVYTCDRSINNLDVYDEKNLIAWDSEGDVFTVLQGGKEAVDEVGKNTEEEKTEGEKAEGTEGEKRSEEHTSEL